MPPLYLVGTVHIDPKGPQRLEKLLNIIRPDIIGVEVTPEGGAILVENEMESEQLLVQMQQDIMCAYGRHMSRLFRQITPEFRDAISDYCYEFIIPWRFKKNNPNSIVVCMDEHDEEMKEIARHEEHDYKMKGIDYLMKAGHLRQEIIDYLDNCDEEIKRQKDDIPDLRQPAPYTSPQTKKEMSPEEISRSIDRLYGYLPFAKEEKSEHFDITVRRRNQTIEQRIRAFFPDTKHSMVYVGGMGHLNDERDNLVDRLKDLNPILIRLNEMDNYRI